MKSPFPSKPTIIINNFINQTDMKDNEFLKRFSNNVHSNVQPICDIVEEIVKSTKNVDIVLNSESSVDQKPQEDVENEILTDNGDVVDNEFVRGVPIASVITGILWILLILFWLLLYFKVLNVFLYKPLPKVLPKTEPTNYESCLMLLRKIGIILAQMWKFDV